MKNQNNIINQYKRNITDQMDTRNNRDFGDLIGRGAA